MTLLFCDSFDHYTTDADLQLKWPNIGNPSYVSIDTTGGRNGTGCLQWSNIYLAQVGRSFPAAETMVVGFAFYATEHPNNYVLLNFIDGSTNHVDLRMTTSGFLQVTRNGTQLGSNGATALTTNVWHYIEMKVTIHDSTGVAIVKLDGVTEIDLSGQDTRNAGNATVDRISFVRQLGGSYNTDVRIDDVVILDTAGSAPTNDFLGDVRVECIMPNGNGNTSNLVGSDGNSTDNYLLVDDPATTDGDTTYVESSTVTDKDTYAFGNVSPTSGTVYGVQITPFACKTDAGTRSIASVARLSGTEVDSADKALSVTYQMLPDMRETKPGGGVWTISDVNSAEFGVKVTA